MSPTAKQTRGSIYRATCPQCNKEIPGPRGNRRLWKQDDGTTHIQRGFSFRCPSCKTNLVVEWVGTEPILVTRFTLRVRGTAVYEKYLKHPQRCPYCDAEEMTSGEMGQDGPTLRGSISCTNCKKTWVEIFTLTDIEEE